jgi:UDP-N-acetylglucosamine--dolichyl-phosphate N-acetylglucosaminephosphotransferase
MIFSLLNDSQSYLNIMVLVFFTISFTFTMLSLPPIIQKLKEKEAVVRDMYKKDRPLVPTNGGLPILLIALFSVSILTLFYGKYITPINYTIIVVVVLFAFFGLLDDMVNIGRPAKLILLYYCSYPLIPFITNTFIVFPFIGPMDLSIIYLQLIVPIFVPVVANLVNMHSGFNGLAPGLSLIVLMTLTLKAFFVGNITNALFIVCLTGAVMAYFWFEKYPSQIFWGNIGALSVGAAIGCMIVTQCFIISGFIMLIPHTVNFLLYVYWRLRSSRYPLVKFGSVREDGTLEVPNPLTLKWVLPYCFRMNEQKATYAMFAVTAVFCVIGFYIPS